MKLDDIGKHEATTRTVGFDDDNVAAGRRRSPVRNYYLLAIAVDEYRDGLKPLANPVRDTNNVVKVLTDVYRFKPSGPEEDLSMIDLRTLPGSKYTGRSEPVWVYNDSDHRRTCLYNSDATWTKIVKKIDAIRAVIGEEDALLIYFAGHGLYLKESKQYFLMCSNSNNSDEQSWLNVATIFQKFNDYKENRKCRDLLLVIDACYSGSAMGGTILQQNLDFSRHLLSSAMSDQLASDGDPERGSDFANAFTSWLQTAGEELPNIWKNPGALISKFDMEQARQRDPGPKQELFLASLPTETGTGFFEFERFDRDKPVLVNLKESLVDNLNFTEHRRALEKFYKVNRNVLNIITSHGYSEELYRLANKITFRWIKRRAKIEFDLGSCQVFEPIKINSTTDDLWQMLYRQLNSASTLDGLLAEPQSIHDHLFKLLRSDEINAGKKHVIVTFYYTIGGRDMAALIDGFSAEFGKLFLTELSKYTEDEQKQLGRMFILFSDERKGAPGFSSADFVNIGFTPAFNFIQIAPFDRINENNVAIWVEAFWKENKNSKIKALDDREVLLAMMDQSGCEELLCGYEEFIEKLTRYCGYNEHEKTTLVNQLYDFQTSSI